MARQSLGDPSAFEGLPLPASPVTASGEDPDEVRELMAQRAAQQGRQLGGSLAQSSPVAQTSPIQPQPETLPNASADGAASPSSSPSRYDAMDAARKAMSGSMSTSNKLMQTADEMQPDPSVARLQQQKLTDEQATPNPKDPKYRPGFGTRLLRGLKGVGIGLAEYGIPGAALGAIDPGLVAGGKGYKAPTDAYDTAFAANQRKLSADTEALSNAQENFKTAQDLRVQREKGLTDAGTQLKDAGTTAKGLMTAQNNADKNAATLRKVGYKTDDDGNIVPLTREEMSPQEQSQADLHDAQSELATAKAELARAQSDPNSPAYKLAMARVQTAARNADAASVRANAYALNAYGANYGTDPNGNPLQGATVMPESGLPTGSRFQGSVQKQQGRVAQFNDVMGALSTLENTAKTLVKANGPGALSSPIVAAGLKQPDSTFSQWLQGQVANRNLTPEQRDYVTNMRAFKENLQALRQSAGGGVSDAQVNRLMEMAPGASTPDLDYLLRQTAQIRYTAQRLSKGIPNVVGGHAVEGSSAKTPAPAQSGTGDNWFDQHPEAK